MDRDLDLFARKGNHGPNSIPLENLYSRQPAYPRAIENQLRAYTLAEQLLLWAALEKGLAEGFGEVHLCLPPADPAWPDVLVKCFPAAQVRWDSPAWVEKVCPCDDGTPYGLNLALQMLSHACCNTLHRFAESTPCFMQRARSLGYAGDFACVVFNHDQAYRIKPDQAVASLPVHGPSPLAWGGRHGGWGAAPPACGPSRVLRGLVPPLW